MDSESEDVLSYGRQLGSRIIQRDKALASNTTDGNVLFYNEIQQVKADIYIQVLCTSPFIRPETIQNAVNYLLEDDTIDSVVLAKEEKRYKWNEGQPLYPIDSIPNSFDLPSEISEAMGLYVIRGRTAEMTKRRIGNAPKLIFGTPLELVDVNTEEDFQLALVIARGMHAEEEKTLKLLAKFLTSPILSDVCDEFGLNAVLSHSYMANIPGSKLLGRARTLHIRRATPSDPHDSIYEALQSYKEVMSNDIIVVKNDEEHLAYFGELNMSLAIRSGAIGAIIGGVTRDTRETRSAGFPVFSKGSYCKDIKGRGAVGSINHTIVLDSVTIRPNDLIFADDDGIVVIPSNKEHDIFTRALSVLQSEKRIIADICSNVAVDKLISKFGFF